jgi:uncharacterized protein YcaQ
MTHEPRRPVPLSAVRALALETQQLTTPLDASPEPNPDTIYETVERLGCVQIDTLQMVRRSQYIALWSRLGRYDPADFNRLIYDPAARRLYEYWQHAASIIPLKYFRYSLPLMARYRNGYGWREWDKQPENQAVIEQVRAHLRANGGARVGDFEYDGPKRGPWWDWKPVKAALEYLFDRGEAMVADRPNFQRVYDLRERVLPEWVDTTEPSFEEMVCFRLDQAARVAGIATGRQLIAHAYLKPGEAASALRSLVEQGALVEVEAETARGSTTTMLVHRDNLPLLEQALDGAISTGRTTFLSPFDSLFWTTGRDEMVFGFRQRLEAYVPAPKRIWGYFCLPILHRDRLIGRFDVKLDRKTGTLNLRALYLEPGVAPDEQLVADIAAAMRDFLVFHDAHDLVIERSDPAGFGEKLLAAL